MDSRNSKKIQFDINGQKRTVQQETHETLRREYGDSYPYEPHPPVPPYRLENFHPNAFPQVNRTIKRTPPKFTKKNQGQSNTQATTFQNPNNPRNSLPTDKNFSGNRVVSQMPSPPFVNLDLEEMNDLCAKGSVTGSTKRPKLNTGEESEGAPMAKKQKVGHNRDCSLNNPDTGCVVPDQNEPNVSYTDGYNPSASTPSWTNKSGVMESGSVEEDVFEDEYSCGGEIYSSIPDPNYDAIFNNLTTLVNDNVRHSLAESDSATSLTTDGAFEDSASFRDSISLAGSDISSATNIPTSISLTKSSKPDSLNKENASKPDKYNSIIESAIKNLPQYGTIQITISDSSLPEPFIKDSTIKIPNKEEGSVTKIVVCNEKNTQKHNVTCISIFNRRAKDKNKNVSQSGYEFNKTNGF